MPRKEQPRPLTLATQLVEAAPDLDTRALALALVARLKFPMSRILARIQGDSITEKARRLGCSRQTYYAWMRGDFRPQGEHARRVSDLTDFSYAEVTGLPETTP